MNTVVIVNASIAGTKATFTCQGIEEDPIDSSKVRLNGLSILVDKVFNFQVISIPKTDLHYYGFGQQVPSPEEIEAEAARATTEAARAAVEAARASKEEEKPASQGNGNSRKKPEDEAAPKAAETPKE